jgi:hypothetical protein
VGNLHRESKSLLGAVVLIGEANNPQGDSYDVRFSLDSPNTARFVCPCAGTRREVTIDLSARTISVGAG